MRIAMEKTVLSCFLYRDLLSEKDFDEIIDFKIPYELFKGNNTHKLMAKAIFNLTEQGMPFDEMTVESYVSKHVDINQAEWLEVLAATPVTFDTMKGHLKQIKVFEQEEHIRRNR